MRVESIFFSENSLRAVRTSEKEVNILSHLEQKMTIVTSECLSENSKSPMKMTKKETEDSTSDLFDDIITDNPLIFRVCCFCLMRSRQRIKPEADEISRSCESAKSEHSKDSE